MRSSSGFLALLAALAAFPLTAAAQNLLVNGDFETPPAGGSFSTRSGSGLTGWGISGNIDHIGGFWAAQSGAQSLDLNGSAGGTITQSVATTAGSRYRLTYAASENFFGFADKTMNVRWNGVIVEQVTITHDAQRTPTHMLWMERTIVVTASSNSSTIAFESTTGAMPGSQGVAPFYGPALDNVRLEPVPCTADFNGDGETNPDDLGDFITCYFTSPPCPGADFNADSDVNPDDLGDFITTYFSGC